MRKVLIFGVNGFVGPYLSQEFLDKGYGVYGTDISDSPKIMRNVIYKKSNIIHEQEVSNLISRVRPDIIVNLAGISSVGISWNIPQTTMEVNVIGALNILEAVKNNSLDSKILFIGSSEEYKSKLGPVDENTQLNANNPYGISKITQGSLVTLYREQYGMKIFEVRPFNHTGIGQNESFVLPSFCKQVAKIEKSEMAGTIRVGNLNIRRDFSHVKDVARAYRMIVETDDYKTVYNIGSGIAYSLNDILDFVINLSKQEIKIEIDSKRLRKTDTPVIQADYKLIRKNLGWEPNYTVWNALTEMYEHFLLQ